MRPIKSWENITTTACIIKIPGSWSLYLEHGFYLYRARIPRWNKVCFQANLSTGYDKLLILSPGSPISNRRCQADGPATA